MKELLKTMKSDERDAMKDVMRAVFAAVSLHAIVTSDRYKGLSASEMAQGAVNLSDDLIKALLK